MGQSGRERRKHHRYVVEGLYVELAGEQLEIIDVSIEAVRIVRPQIELSVEEPVAFHIKNNQWGEPADIALTGRLIRSGNGFVVFGYDIPFAEWEDFLRRHDTFERVALGSIGF
jgi:hypothetical protein